MSLGVLSISGNHAREAVPSTGRRMPSSAPMVRQSERRCWSATHGRAKTLIATSLSNGAIMAAADIEFIDQGGLSVWISPNAIPLNCRWIPHRDRRIGVAHNRRLDPGGKHHIDKAHRLV